MYKKVSKNKKSDVTFVIWAGTLRIYVSIKMYAHKIMAGVKQYFDFFIKHMGNINSYLCKIFQNFFHVFHTQ